MQRKIIIMTLLTTLMLEEISNATAFRALEF